MKKKTRNFYRYMHLDIFAVIWENACSGYVSAYLGKIVSWPNQNQIRWLQTAMKRESVGVRNRITRSRSLSCSRHQTIAENRRLRSEYDSPPFLKLSCGQDFCRASNPPMQGHPYTCGCPWPRPGHFLSLLQSYIFPIAVGWTVISCFASSGREYTIRYMNLKQMCTYIRGSPHVLKQKLIPTENSDLVDLNVLKKPIENATIFPLQFFWGMISDG